LTHPKPTVRVLCKLTQFIRQVALLRAEVEPPKLFLQSDLRRRAASRWAQPHICSLFFFRHEISELPRPIAVKLCHMIAICVRFITQVQKFGGPPPQKLWAQNMQNLGQFHIQLQTLIANIFGTGQGIRNRKAK